MLVCHLLHSSDPCLNIYNQRWIACHHLRISNYIYHNFFSSEGSLIIKSKFRSAFEPRNASCLLFGFCHILTTSVVATWSAPNFVRIFNFWVEQHQCFGVQEWWYDLAPSYNFSTCKVTFFIKKCCSFHYYYIFTYDQVDRFSRTRFSLHLVGWNGLMLKVLCCTFDHLICFSANFYWEIRVVAFSLKGRSGSKKNFISI